MKKTLFMLAFAMPFVFNTVTAQIQKGNILAGGDIANFDLGLEEGSVFTMRINPKLAFFIRDNVALGGYVDLNLQSVAGATAFGYGVGALGRYYFSDKNNLTPLRHSRIFAEANFGIEGDNVTGGASTNGLGFGFGPGYAYFITPSIGLETLLKYNGNLGFGSSTYQSHINLNVGFQIYLPTRGLKSKVQSDVK